MLCGFLVQSGFQFSDGGQIVTPPTKELDDFDRRSEVRQWIDLEDFEGLHTPNASIGILLEQGIEHLAGLIAILGEDISLPYFVGSLAACEWGLIKGDMTNEIKRVKAQTNLLSEFLQKYPTT